MIIAITNLQSIKRLQHAALRRLLRFLVNRAYQTDAISALGFQLSVVITDNLHIRRLSRRYFKRDDPTDVIAFNYRRAPLTRDGIAGEIVVNLERALEYGRGRSGCDRELALYLAHGCDHLSGATDASPEERRRMRRRELRWLQTAQRLQLMKRLTGEHRSRR
jgi:rRNA maturation RNase YbeY